MPTVTWIPELDKIVNTIDAVDASTVNGILKQYEQRDQYLYERIDEIAAKDVLISFSVPVGTGAGLVAGDVVYYKKTPAGLAKALASYDNSLNNLYYSPADSCYTYGIVKQTTSEQADVFTHGLIQNLAISSMLQANDTFRVGPYFLSKTVAGKITSNPSGVPIYVGYAISATQFLISPYVHEALSFYLGFKYALLDRPSGTPLLTGSTWTVTSPDYNELGWVPSAGEVGAPAGAYFKYNIPQNLSLDTEITEEESESAAGLRQTFPPWPFNTSYLTVNGIEQVFGGIFTVNQFGIWWLNNQAGYQPWASDFVNWETNKGTDNLRPKMMFTFIKVNPDLKKSVVTSLKPSPNSNIRFVRASDPNIVDMSGDLLAEVDVSVTTTSAINPSGVAVKSISTSEDGISITTGAVISTVSGSNGISVAVDTNGNAVISSSVNGLSGEVGSLEPEGADLEYYGLNSFLTMYNPAGARGNTGFKGKILLPLTIPNTPLNVRMLLAGKGTVASLKNLAFTFSYATSTPTSVLNQSITAATADVALPASSYAAYTTFLIQPVLFRIPAAMLTPGGIVNFEVTRKTPSVDNYAFDVGTLSVRWSF